MNPSDFMGAFLEELSEQLTQMEQAILDLEQRSADEETIQVLFRAAHTLKGSSAAMGFETMTRLTHEMEQVLDEVRNNHVTVSESIIHLFFRCCDNLRIFRENIADGVEESINLEPLLAELHSCLPREGGLETDIDNEARVDSATLLENETGVDDEDERLQAEHDLDVQFRIAEAGSKGLRTYEVQLVFDTTSVMRGIRAYIAHDRLSELGDILAVTPSLEDMEGMEDGTLTDFRMVVSGGIRSESVEQAVSGSDFSQIIVTELGLQGGEVTQAVSQGNPQSQSQTHQSWSQNKGNNPRPSERPPNGNTTDVPTVKRRSQTVRVDVEHLEALMNLVGELVIDQARIDQVNRVLGKRYASDEQVRALDDIAGHVSRVVSQLQEHVMTARMVPIESLFDRFPRVVRDLAKTLKKDVKLVIEGHETRLDRTVIEEIADPLIHLIRNAVDHGLERPEDRTASGKPAQGCLTLAATHEDNKVVLTVTDDGAGIDAHHIRQIAMEKGIISEEEADKLTVHESLNLVFRPGFSTAKAVSDISGRGVGMDIVRNHIEKLSGTIDIETKLGEGTTFRIKLPLTLAIISGLLIGVANRTFVVPLGSVSEIVRVSPESIQKVNGKPTILLRGQATPVLYLRQFFHLPKVEEVRKQVLIVVVHVAEKRLAMVVDELHGNQEIVKKAFGERVGSPEGISGATILGNGRIGLILDVASICKTSA